MLRPNHTGNCFLIVCGVSFAGKSTLGKAIRERFGYVEVDVDETKVQLFGKEIRDEDILPDQWAAIYSTTDQRIEDLLQSGQSVLDASRNFQRAERVSAKSIADRAGVPFLVLYIDTPVEIARQRWLDNRGMFQRRDVSDKDFEDTIRAMQVPLADEAPLIFHYSDEIDPWLVENASKISCSSQF
jgi:predicted kinase